MSMLCTLASGSTGNCILVSQGGRNILVDMGISMKRTASALSELSLKMSDISAVLITHSHSDHIGGLNTMCKKWDVPIFATSDTARGIRSTCPAADGRVCTFEAGSEFSAGGFNVKSFATPHDCPGSVCFRIGLDGGDVGVMTDLGYVPPKVLYGMEGVGALVLESNHDVERLMYGPYPYSLKQRILSDHGHLSNDSACEAAVWYAERGTRQFILAHLSKENNTPALAREAAEAALAPFDGVSLYISPPELAEPIEI